MSIPKEPRQLLVNLMYIVLTALLALNVSAEVLHAFFSIDDSLSESNRLVDGSNQQLVAAINEQAEAYTQFAPYRAKAEEARKTARSFFDLVEKMKSELVEAAGGIGDDGLPKRKDDKDVTTRLFVKEGRGDQLERSILETREKLLDLVDDPTARAAIAAGIPLKINGLPPGTDKKTWAAFQFQQMPMAAVMPLLTKFQNDVKVAETAILNHYADQLNVTTVKPDQFAPVISAEKNYVIRGEQYRGEIFLAAYSSTADNIAVKVDGHPLSVEGGKAIFTAQPSSNGTRHHEMEITLTNPLTGEVETFAKQFTYEVGERAVTVAADKMNVLYRGVENPISVVAAGIPTTEMRVSAEGVRLERKGNGKFLAVPQGVNQATITVSGGGLPPTTFEYRVKRIPDPVVKLGNLLGGHVPVAHFKVQQGLIPHLLDFEFDAKAKISSFELVRLRDGDAATAKNHGGRFGSAAQRLVDNAERGDIFYFDEIKVHCPGDNYDRRMPGLIFNLK